jgi:hypothetical protein
MLVQNADYGRPYSSASEADTHAQIIQLCATLADKGMSPIRHKTACGMAEYQCER